MTLTNVDLGIVAAKLAAVSEEMCLTLQRTSRSLYVKETADFCCAIAGPDGRFVAYPKAIGVSGFVGLDVLETVRAAEVAGPLEPGDVVVANDPYRTGGLATHLPDIQMVAPYFLDGEVVAYGWAFIHCSDIGGRVPSSVSPFNDSIFAEGLRIPPVRLVRGGTTVPDVEALLLANTRTPEANRGDLQAMVSALATGRRRVGEVAAQHGRAAVLEGGESAVARTRERAREALRSLTDGTYRFVDLLDNDAVSPVPVRISVTVTVDDGRIHIDFTGTDPQVAAAFNIASFGRPHAWLTTRVLALIGTIDPDLALNGGLMDLISITAPPGSVVNAVEPAAVGVRHATASRVNDALSGALIQAAPRIVPAASSGVVIPVVLAEETGTGQNVQVVEPMVGGTGGRYGGDGVDGRDAGISNLSNNPVETVEAELGARILRYGLRPDSGGPGTWRGGMGLELVFRVDGTSSLLARGLERQVFAPWGAMGGSPGLTAEIVINEGTDRAVRVRTVDVLPLDPGDVVTIRTPGGGGYGDPFERDVAAVLDDVRRGLVTRERARADYGVAVTDGLTLDETETAHLREERPSTGSGRGLARERWDAVFTEDLHDALVEALDALPVGRRSARKIEIVREVLAVLPAGFPGVDTADGELEAARRRLGALLGGS
ncbi:hydantoinase B/oxoprolinase family protein [Georgenia sp. M64]|uniref:hydantoinase B/oxoprolinase family protein n=1 Tax=Georgenia sp. M64 TaxID=3120520 RepID=UPI0030E2B288